MKPRFIHKKKKIDLTFYSELIPKAKFLLEIVVKITAPSLIEWTFEMLF